MAIHPERMYPERMYMLHRKDQDRHKQVHSYAQAGAVCSAANECAGVAKQRKQRLVLDHRSSAPGPGGTDVPGLQRCLQGMIRVC